MLAAIVGVAVVLGPAAPPAGGPPVQERVGLITLTGNTVTPDGDILDLLGLYPGGGLPDEAGLLRLEMKLLLAFHRRFDLDAGQRPRIELAPNDLDSLFRDVVVTFPEKGSKPKKKRGG